MGKNDATGGEPGVCGGEEKKPKSYSNVPKGEDRSGVLIGAFSFFIDKELEKKNKNSKLTYREFASVVRKGKSFSP